MSQEIGSLKNTVDFLRDPPVLFQCATKNSYDLDSSVVTYDNLIYSQTNTWTESSGLDIASGIFTAPYPGAFTLSYQVQSDINNEQVVIYIRKGIQYILVVISFHYYIA